MVSILVETSSIWSRQAALPAMSRNELQFGCEVTRQVKLDSKTLYHPTNAIMRRLKMRNSLRVAPFSQLKSENGTVGPRL
jgi:hypothetical protein